MRFLIVLTACTIAAITPSSSLAADFSVKVEEDGVSILINGELFTKYVTKGEGNKPYFWPIIGPTGKQMTRAYPMQDVKGEKQDHVHHRSMWFGHQRINGFDTWHEPATFEERFRKKPKELAARLKTLGVTVHRNVVETRANSDHAILVTEADYTDPDGNRLMQDKRRFTFRVAPDTGSRIIDMDMTLVGSEETVTLDDAKDSGFSVRVAHTMCVDAKEGGSIVNSNGDRDKAAWGKRASWCDFFGPVEGETLGIAILHHPASFRYPNPWHARTYGLFTANPFGLKSVAGLGESGAVELKRGETLSLRYRVIFHQGDAERGRIKDAFAAYAE